MIKIFKSKNWERFDGSREQAIKHIKSYLESMDYEDCDNCWEEYVELYDSDTDEITVFAAYYSGWSNGQKIYPVEINIYEKEELKELLKETWGVKNWAYYLTQLDPKRDYIIV